MMLSALPVLRLPDLADAVEQSDTLVLCASSRLAQDLRRAHAALCAVAGGASWRALAVATPAQWLDHVVSAALLRGEVPVAAMPKLFLTATQENALWQEIIRADADAVLGSVDLFDLPQLAKTAREADALQHIWRLSVPEGWADDEYRAFRRWQRAMQERCEAEAWLREVNAFDWRVACVARGILGLPAKVVVAGFVGQDSPQLSKLLATLDERGVEIARLDIGLGDDVATGAATGAATGDVQHVICDDAAGECRAAALWARDILVRQPAARLRIVVLDLEACRTTLARALDDALHPEWSGAAWATQDRIWALATPQALADQALIDTALRLLQLAVYPRRVGQGEFGDLLRAIGWSRDIEEADARALFEHFLRDRLPPEASLDRYARQLQRSGFDGQLPALASALDALGSTLSAATRRQLPHAWGRLFKGLLESVSWPGQRSPSAQEASAIEDFLGVLDGLAHFDAVSGKITASNALRLVTETCRGRSSAAPRDLPPQIEVCRMDEAIATPVDALWVMGLNEGIWPLPPRPNPLLPAAFQRRAGIVEAGALSMAALASAHEAAWLASSPHVTLSSARKAGERELRPSGLLARFPVIDLAAIADQAPEFARLEAVEDSLGPPVADGERVRGGTWLLQAQAVCPAWGFFEYRLSTAVIPTPTFGLDPRGRGLLLHSALEQLWRGRSSADMAALTADERAALVRCSVADALTAHEADGADALPTRFRNLEQERLERLIAHWLDIELGRAPFRVVACEEKYDLLIEGLPVRVVIDRVDELDDGRWVILDYKSGRSASADSWADARISEPQLPIYAALVFPEQDVAAVALARVTLDEAGFVGVAADDGLLPKLKSLDVQRKRYAEERFPDWSAVRRHWAEAVRAIAREVRQGQASVCFDDEAALTYCDVKPLLRVAERRRQWQESLRSTASPVSVAQAAGADSEAAGGVA